MQSRFVLIDPQGDDLGFAEFPSAEAAARTWYEEIRPEPAYIIEFGDPGQEVTRHDAEDVYNESR